MKIVLVGYMGSGKTTIGKLLAKKLKISFLDLDEVIEEGLEDSISNIFNGKGEIFFRKKEHEYLNEVLSKKKQLYTIYWWWNSMLFWKHGHDVGVGRSCFLFKSFYSWTREKVNVGKRT